PSTPCPIGARRVVMSHHPTDGSDRRQTEGAPMPRSIPRYNIVLQSDPTLDLMHIVRSLMQLIRFPREEATHKMWQAQHGGRRVILQTYLERAELYVEQFAEKGLKVAIEPA